MSSRKLKQVKSLTCLASMRFKSPKRASLMQSIFESNQWRQCDHAAVQGQNNLWPSQAQPETSSLDRKWDLTCTHPRVIKISVVAWMADRLQDYFCKFVRESSNLKHNTKKKTQSWYVSSLAVGISWAEWRCVRECEIMSASKKWINAEKQNSESVSSGEHVRVAYECYCSVSS